jgi:outer membrane receptor protein involved in Fe transport
MTRRDQPAPFGELSWPRAAPRSPAGCAGAARRGVRRHLQSPGHLLGGDVSLTHRLRESATLWARVARGFKAGGFNASLVGVPGAEDQLEFAPEYLWNYEVGLRLQSGMGAPAGR